MIPVGTSVNPGELRSGPKWEKTFTSCLGVPDTSPGTHRVYTCMVFSFLIMVSTPGFGPSPLTNSAGAPLRDLVIQFLTVYSGNLPRASLTSWTH